MYTEFTDVQFAEFEIPGTALIFVFLCSCPWEYYRNPGLTLIKYRITHISISLAAYSLAA